MIRIIKISSDPFDSFELIYKIITRAGCYKLREPSSRCQLYCHNFYRLVVFSLAVMYVTHQFIICIKYLSNMDIFVEILVVEIIELNYIMKYLTLYFRRSRLEQLREVIKGPFFAAKGAKDEEYLKDNSVMANMLVKFINISVVFCVVLWILAHYFKKMQGEPVIMPLFLFLDRDTWFGFSVYVAARVGLAALFAHGHMSIDCAVATYYAQATVQLKILKYNLEHIFDEGVVIRPTDKKLVYTDIEDETVKERFIYYVHRYEKINWFTKEVSSIFNYAIFFQFFTTCTGTCFAVYLLSYTDFSAQFIFLVVLLVLFLVQVSLYCYFGSLVEYESLSLCQAAGGSDWLSISPSLRRSLVIAMTRWSQPMRTRVAYVVPLSTSTSVSILKFAYTLFTILSEMRD